MMIAAQKGLLYTGCPHTRPDEGEVASKKLRRGSAKTKCFDFPLGRTVFRWLLGLQFLSLFIAGQVHAKNFTESEPNGPVFNTVETFDPSKAIVGYYVNQSYLDSYFDSLKSTVRQYDYNNFGRLGGKNIIKGKISARRSDAPADEDIFRFSPKQTGQAKIAITTGNVRAQFCDCSQYGTVGCEPEGWEGLNVGGVSERTLFAGDTQAFFAYKDCTYYIRVEGGGSYWSTDLAYTISLELQGSSDDGGSSVVNGDTSFYVTFNGNGGDVINTVGRNCGQSMRLEKTIGSTYGTLPTATWQGRIFNGWFTSSVNGSKVTASTKVSKSVTALYAHWSQQSHTVSYKKGSYGVGTDTQDSKVYGTPLTLKGALFTRKGYSQVGWESSGGVDYALKGLYSREENVTLYPRWESTLPTSYVIKFNPNGGAGTMANQTCQYGTDTRLRANTFTRTGYKFLGWSLSQTATSPTYSDQKGVNFTRSSQVEYVLYAVWKAVNVPGMPGAVSFMSNGGSGTMNSQSYTIGKPLQLRICAFWRAGYDFRGWALSAAGAVKYFDGETFTPNQGTSLKLYAVWTPKSVVVTFNENLPDFISTRDSVYVYGNVFGKLPEPSNRRGYAFLGWYTDRIAGTVLTSATTVPVADTVYYAHWVAVDEKVKVLLNVNGGIAVTPSSVEYVIGASRVTTFGSLPQPTHGQDKVFSGWYDAPVGGNRISPDSLVTGDIMQLYAHWSTSVGLGDDGYYVLSEGEFAIGQASMPLLVQGSFPAYSARKAGERGKVTVLSFSVAQSGNYDVYLPLANVEDRVVDLEGTKYSDLVTAKNAVELEVCTASGEVIAQCDVGKTSVYLTRGTSYLLKVIHIGWRQGGLPTAYWEQVNYSAQIGGSVPIVSYLDAPTGVNASTNLAEGVRIKWNPVAAAKRYVVYKWHIPPEGKTGDSAYPYELGWTEGTEYLDTPTNVPTREARMPLKTLRPELLDDSKPFGGTYHVVAVGDTAKSSASTTVEGRVVENLVLSTTSAEVAAVGGELRVFVLGSVDWEFLCSADWVDIQVEKRSWCESELRMFVSPNESSTPRRCVCYVGGQSIQIVQKESGDDVQVSFETEGGAPLEDQIYKSGACFTDLPIPEKTGYSFVGWKTGSAVGGNTVTRADLVGDSNQRLFADWRPNTYCVRFDGNGATGGSSSDQFFEYDVPQKLAPNGYVCQGHTMVGWALRPDGEVFYDNEEEVVNLTSVDQIVLYARWRRSDKPVLIPGERVEIDIGLKGYAPTGLPAGLTYDRTMGMITGAPTKPTGEEGAVVKFTKSGAATEEMTIIVKAFPKVVVGVAGTGTGKVTGAGAYAAGKKVTLKAMADTKDAAATVKSVFAGWYAGDELLSQATSYVIDKMPAEDVALTAKFLAVADDAATVSFALPAELATGETAVDAAIDVSRCTSLPTVKVTGLPAGLKFTAKVLDVKATAKTSAAHYAANTIYGTPTKSGVYTVVVTATTAGKKTVSASQTVVVRKAGEYVVKAEIPAINGQVPGKVTGMGVYAKDKKVTLKVTANKGYVFSGWSDGDIFLTQAASYVIDKMPANDVNLTAAFVTADEDAAWIGATVDDLPFGACDATGAVAAQTNVTAGVYLAWPVATETLSATTVAVSGLPAGLKFTAKDIFKKGSKTEVEVPANTIYGAPTAASKADKSGNIKPSVVKVTVTTAGKNKQVYQLDVTVDPLPAWAIGTFAGPSYGDGGTNGLASVVVASSGKISVKQPVGGKAASFAATCFDRYDAETGTYVATLTAKVGTEVVTNVMAVAPSVDALGVAVSDLFDAWRYDWKVEPWKSIGKTFDGHEQSYEEECVKVTLRFSANGTVKVAGEFAKLDADGNYVYKNGVLQTVKVSGSATLLPTAGEGGRMRYLVFVYLAPKGLPAHARSVEVADAEVSGK